MIISYAIRIAFYIKLAAKELKESVRWSYLKEWLKVSPINIYSVVGNRITAFTLIFLFVYGGKMARGYQQAAATFTNVAGYSCARAHLAVKMYRYLL